MSRRVTGSSAVAGRVRQRQRRVKEVVHRRMDTSGHCWLGAEEQGADVGDGNRAVELARSVEDYRVDDDLAVIPRTVG